MAARTAPPTPQPGLRETKKQKQESRRLISDCATRLFLAQGFEQTSITEIAAAARVAKKTVTNYFPRKEDLALDRQDAFIASLARTVTGRRPGESALAALRARLRRRGSRRRPGRRVLGSRVRAHGGRQPHPDDPRLRELHDLREAALARALTETTGAEPDDVGVRTAAGLLGAVHRILFDRIQRLTLAGEDEARIRTEITAAAEDAFGLVEPALGGYAIA